MYSDVFYIYLITHILINCITMHYYCIRFNRNSKNQIDLGTLITTELTQAKFSK